MNATKNSPALRKFSDAHLGDYRYDPVRQQVISYKVKANGAPRAWSVTNGIARVGLVNRFGNQINVRKDMIERWLEPVQPIVRPSVTNKAVRRPVTAVAADHETVLAVTNSLAMLAPDYEYVMFSTKNRCSQYFYAGTTVADALAMFARRNEIVRPEDVRILNVKTNTVSSLTPQVVTTYKLVG
jgi:hypothetical protein